MTLSAFKNSFCSENLEYIEPKGKIINAKQMMIINFGIALDPDFMVNAWMAKEAARDTLNKIYSLKNVAQNNNTTKLFSDSSEETKFIKKHLDQVTASLDVFFGPVRSYKKIVIPLLEKSLGTSTKSGSYESNPPILIKFFNSDTSISVKSFFNGEVLTLDALTATCNEFMTFFNDLLESLSERAKNKYHEALKKKISELKHNQQTTQKK